MWVPCLEVELASCVFGFCSLLALVRMLFRLVDWIADGLCAVAI
jgi:hypothetical protein